MGLPPLVQELLDFLQKIDVTNMQKPDKLVQKGEEVVGVVPDFLRPLWAVTQLVYEEAIELARREHGAIRADLPQTEMGLMVERLQLFGAKKDFFEAAFLCSLRREFPQYGNAERINIGVREGWKVVVAPKLGKRRVGMVVIQEK